ncbi:MAG: cyclic nucleotide-binding domain-containing protein [Bacteroidota bacterium]
MHFIERGHFKLYLVDADQGELILDICCEGQFVWIPQELMRTFLDAALYLVAMRDCELLTLSKDKLDKLALQFPDLQKQLGKIQDLILLRQMKHVSLLLKTSTQRWSFLMESFKEICQVATEPEVCKFCGIGLRTLSRSKSMYRLKRKSAKKPSGDA